MEYTMGQIVAIIGGAALLLLALFGMYRDAASRATEALLDRVEVALARREQRRAPRRRAVDEAIHASVFTHS